MVCEDSSTNTMKSPLFDNFMYFLALFINSFAFLALFYDFSCTSRHFLLNNFIQEGIIETIILRSFQIKNPQNHSYILYFIKKDNKLDTLDVIDNDNFYDTQTDTQTDMATL